VVRAKEPSKAEILRDLRKLVDSPAIQCMRGLNGEPQFLRSTEYLLCLAEAGLDAYSEAELRVEIEKRDRVKESLGLARLWDKLHPLDDLEPTTEELSRIYSLPWDHTPDCAMIQDVETGHVDEMGKPYTACNCDAMRRTFLKMRKE